MEGGSHFEGEPKFNRHRHQETPQQSFRNELRRNMKDILSNTPDSFAIEVANKILEKLDIKDQIDEIQEYKDDAAVYQPWKQLGLFIVIDRNSRINWKDENTGLEIKKGDRILDIHLPPVPKEQATNANVAHSMQLITEYIARQKIDAKYIMGVTFEKLARASASQGFTVIEPQIPTNIKQGIERVYERFGNNSRLNKQSMGKILLCYQTTQQFLERYLPKR